MKHTLRPRALYWASFNRFELRLPGEAVQDCSHQGQCDDDVAHWAPRITRPARCTVEALRKELKECGAELRGRLDKIREGFEAAVEAPERPDELVDIVARAEALEAAYQSALASAEEGFERRGGGFGGGQFVPPPDERFADLLHDIKLRSLRRASAALKASRETDFAAIDEAIATHRAADTDHGPRGNQEAQLGREIDRLKTENQTLRVKLSRMCGDA